MICISGSQLMAMPPNNLLLRKIQIGLTCLVPAYPGCPGKEAVKWVSVVFTVTLNCVIFNVCSIMCVVHLCCKFLCMSVALAWHPIHECLFASGGSDGSIMYWLTK